MERPVATQFELIDPPELIEVKYHQIEDGLGRKFNSPFVHFLWHGSDFWLLGKLVWRNAMTAGEVYLRLPKGRNIFVAGITVHPDQGDMTFTVGKPRYRITRKNEAFSFLGFTPRTVVDVDFVREEEKRLIAMPLVEYLNRTSKAPRPPAGHVV